MSDHKKIAAALQLLECFKLVGMQVPGMPSSSLAFPQPKPTLAKNSPTALEKSTETFVTKEQAEEIQDEDED